MERLTGEDLLSAIRECGDASKEVIWRNCGYASFDSNGNEVFDSNGFYDQLLIAKGVSIPPTSPSKAGHESSTNKEAKVIGNSVSQVLQLRSKKNKDGVINKVKNKLQGLFKGTRLTAKAVSYEKYKSGVLFYLGDHQQNEREFLNIEKLLSESMTKQQAQHHMKSIEETENDIGYFDIWMNAKIKLIENLAGEQDSPILRGNSESDTPPEGWKSRNYLRILSNTVLELFSFSDFSSQDKDNVKTVPGAMSQWSENSVRADWGRGKGMNLSSGYIINDEGIAFATNYFQAYDLKYEDVRTKLAINILKDVFGEFNHDECLIKYQEAWQETLDGFIM